MGFKKDLKRGLAGEALFIQLLTKVGLTASQNNNIKHDVHFEFNQKDVLCEIKYDYYAAKSGNLAIEFFNSKTCKPSGINATHSHFWIHILSESEIYGTRVDQLKNFIDNNKPWKTMMGVGDGNADIHLYRKEDILPIFTNLCELSNEELLNWFNLGIAK